MPTAKRIVIISDLHCGSEAGLSPEPTNPTQSALLARYKDAISRLGVRPDCLIVNGDAIDGTQERGAGPKDSGILDLQIANAFDLIAMWRPRQIWLVAGTMYHVGGDSIEAESMLASMFKRAGVPAEFTRKLNLTVNDWFRLQCRHHIGSSGIPHGRFTPQNRSRMWGIINAAANGSKPPHLSCYSHVHYFTFSEDDVSAVVTTPAWQAIGSRYGDERCDGRCVLGALALTVGKREDDGWHLAKRLYAANVISRSVRL